MAEANRSTVFGKRNEPHTVIIARGDDIRHFQVRPWLVAVAGSAFAAMAIGYLLATTYLVLRDDLIDATTARQARLQQAYDLATGSKAKLAELGAPSAGFFDMMIPTLEEILAMLPE